MTLLGSFRHLSDCIPAKEYNWDVRQSVQGPIGSTQITFPVSQKGSPLVAVAADIVNAAS